MVDRRLRGLVDYFAQPGCEVLQLRACFPGRCLSLLHLAPSGQSIGRLSAFDKKLSQGAWPTGGRTKGTCALDREVTRPGWVSRGMPQSGR